jgi:hypothetical protein
MIAKTLGSGLVGHATVEHASIRGRNRSSSRSRSQSARQVAILIGWARPVAGKEAGRVGSTRVAEVRRSWPPFLGRVHHIEFKDPNRIEDVRRDMIVEAAPVVSGPRSADRNIAANAADGDGIYRPSRHLERIHDNFKRQGKDPEAFIRSHVRRLEALRRAGHVERIDADHWKVPKDIVERGQVYDLSQGGDGLRVRTLSVLNLEKQIGSHGATWLDRELIARERMATADSGFGRQVNNALSRRAQRLVEMGHATAKDGNIHISASTVATLQRQEVERVGQ